MNQNNSKSNVTGKILIWFIIISTLIVVFITIKLFIASFSFRNM
jgi:hypothetical protein